MIFFLLGFLTAYFVGGLAMVALIWNAGRRERRHRALVRKHLEDVVMDRAKSMHGLS